MENWRTEELLDIGEWVATEDGYGQILFNRNLYYEEFDKATGNHIKVGTLRRTIHLCKILSDFDGIVKKRIKLDIYTSVNKLRTREKELVDKIREEHPKEYNRYLLSEPRENVTRQIFLDYRFHTNEVELMKKEILRIRRSLRRTFSFKEFEKEGDNSNLPFRISEFLKYGEIRDRSKCITLRFDSQLYRTMSKEALFDNVVVIKL